MVSRVTSLPFPIAKRTYTHNFLHQWQISFPAQNANFKIKFFLKISTTRKGYYILHNGLDPIKYESLAPSKSINGKTDI